MAVAVETLDKFAGVSLRAANVPPKHPWGVCIALYGPAGAGKTTWAASIADDPENGSVLDMDAEGGARSIAHRPDIIVPEDPITSADQIDKFVQRFKQDCPFGSVIADNLSEYQELYVKRAQGTSERRKIQHWGAATTNMLQFTRDVRNLSRLKNVNVVLIAWDAPEKDEFTGIIKRDVGFTPSLARQFPGIVDIVAFLEPTTRPDLRRLTLEASPRLAAKFRRSMDENARTLPGQIYIQMKPDGTLSPSLADVVRVLKGKEKWDASKFPKAPGQGGAQAQASS